MSFCHCLAHGQHRCAVALGGMALASAGVAVSQAYDLRITWKKCFSGQVPHCCGPTEGVEKRILNERRKVLSADGSCASSMPTFNSPPTSSRTLVLFLGDSLVSGVGGQTEGTTAPAALPHGVALHLAEQGGQEVQWASVGITGACVERLMKEGLPQLKSKIDSQTDAARVVVVLVVGANDLRKCNFGFRLKLRRLVNELRHVIRDDQQVDGVFLPALRLADAPFLQRYPLNCFLRPICALWEREKRKAVGCFEDVEVVPFPQVSADADTAELFCTDQIHPSPTGYEWWANSLAQQIHSRLQERSVRERRNSCRSSMRSRSPSPVSVACVY